MTAIFLSSLNCTNKWNYKAKSKERNKQNFLESVYLGVGGEQLSCHWNIAHLYGGEEGEVPLLNT